MFTFIGVVIHVYIYWSCDPHLHLLYIVCTLVFLYLEYLVHNNWYQRKTILRFGFQMSHIGIFATTIFLGCSRFRNFYGT